MMQEIFFFHKTNYQALQVKMLDLIFVGAAVSNY